MMPPTSIDGTDITGATIDGTDVTEITVDGDTVFSAVPVPPENFEHNDLTGQYGGDTGVFNIQSSTVDEGSFALNATTSNTANVIARSTTTPFARMGIRVDYRIYIDDVNSAIGGIAFATSVTGWDNHSGYLLRVSDNYNGFEIVRRDNGGFNRLKTGGANISEQVWVDASVEFQSGGDIVHTVDGTSLTVNDSTHTNLLLGWEIFRGDIYFDDVRFSNI